MIAKLIGLAEFVDHVHLAVRLGRTISQADLIETIKTSSSAWIKKQGNTHRSFFWQRGYGAFSVGFSQLDSLLRYIDTPEEHHRTKTFQVRAMPRRRTCEQGEDALLIRSRDGCATLNRYGC